MKSKILPFNFNDLNFIAIPQKFFVVLILLCGTIHVHAQNPFITTWKTNNSGSSNDNQITIPAHGSFTYSWESADDPSVTGAGEGSGNHTLTFPEEGIYQVSMTPAETDAFNQIQFDFGGDRKKILSVDQWGDIQWSSFSGAYTETSNLKINATDAPNLEQVTEMTFAFFESGIGEEGNFNAWDVSSVVNMEAAFFGTRNFNQPLDAWNTENVQILKGMFAGSRVFNMDISAWNVSAVTDMSFMFQDAQVFNQSLNGWDVSQVENMSYIFSNTPVFNGEIDQWDVSYVKNMEGMFTVAYGFNQPLTDWDVSGALDFWGMFSGSGFNQNLGSWNLAQATNLTVMLNGSAMDCENYSNTLLGWSENLDLSSNMELGANELLYSPDVEQARDYLINTLGWSIEGDALGNCTLGVEQHDALQVTIYPNPSNGLLNIDSAHKIDTIRVYDLSGKLLKTENNVANLNFQMDLSDFAKGVYLIKTISGNSANTYKIILK